MQPFQEISLIETAETKCHLIQTPKGFNLSYQQIFPLSQSDMHSIVTFLEQVRADQHLPHQYAHGHLFLNYAPEEASNQVAMTYGERRITMELATALLLLDSLKDRGPA
jgi:hypothetical protein